MKKLLLIGILFIAVTISRSQTINCTNFCVLDIAIDTAHDELGVTIYNGDTNQVNYPTVVVTNAIGDTVGNINNTFYLFAQMAGDTVVHSIPTSLTSFPPGFTGTVYLTDQIWDITCSFSYPMACTVGIDELASAENMIVYPNPASGNITVRLNKTDYENTVINMYDVTGKLVRSYNTTGTSQIINREGLQGGLYFITADTRNRRSTIKLIIK